MSRTLKSVLNEGNPNTLGDASQALPLGTGLANGTQTFVGDPSASGDALSLPESVKGLAVLSVFASAAGTPVEVVPVAPTATLSAGECQVNAVGDIAFFPGDSIDYAEVAVVVAEGSLVEETVSVLSDVAVMNNRSGRVLLSAEATAGTALGPKTVVVRGVAPAAGQAGLDAAGKVAFNAADAVTQATIKYIQMPPQSVGEALGADSDLL